MAPMRNERNVYIAPSFLHSSKYLLLSYAYPHPLVLTMVTPVPSVVGVVCTVICKDCVVCTVICKDCGGGEGGTMPMNCISP